MISGKRAGGQEERSNPKGHWAAGAWRWRKEREGNGRDASALASRRVEGIQPPKEQVRRFVVFYRERGDNPKDGPRHLGEREDRAFCPEKGEGPGGCWKQLLGASTTGKRKLKTHRDWKRIQRCGLYGPQQFPNFAAKANGELDFALGDPCKWAYSKQRGWDTGKRGSPGAARFLSCAFESTWRMQT